MVNEKLTNEHSATEKESEREIKQKNIGDQKFVSEKGEK